MAMQEVASDAFLKKHGLKGAGETSCPLSVAASAAQRVARTLCRWQQACEDQGRGVQKDLCRVSLPLKFIWWLHGCPTIAAVCSFQDNAEQSELVAYMDEL